MYLGAFTAEGTPKKTKEASQFSLFVKKHFTTAKETLSKASCGSVKHGEVMKILGQMFKEQTLEK